MDAACVRFIAVLCFADCKCSITLAMGVTFFCVEVDLFAVVPANGNIPLSEELARMGMFNVFHCGGNWISSTLHTGIHGMASCD